MIQRPILFISAGCLCRTVQYGFLHRPCRWRYMCTWCKSRSPHSRPQVEDVSHKIRCGKRNIKQWNAVLSPISCKHKRNLRVRFYEPITEIAVDHVGRVKSRSLHQKDFRFDFESAIHEKPQSRTQEQGSCACVPEGTLLDSSSPLQKLFT